MRSYKNITWSPDKYRQSAVIADLAGNELLNRLAWMTLKPKCLVDMGCGLGNMSSKLKARFPDAVVIALDHSEKMLEHAYQHASNACLHADTTHLPFKNQSVDLIFANFIMPWQEEVTAVLKEWRRVLRPEGLLMMTAFGPDTLKEWSHILPSQELPQRIDMHDYGDALLATGFADPVLDVDHYTLTYRNKKKLFQELLESGMWFPEEETNTDRIDSFEESLLEVTYEVIFAHAFVPIPNPRDTKVVKIPFEHMRRQLRKPTE